MAALAGMTTGLMPSIPTAASPSAGLGGGGPEVPGMTSGTQTGTGSTPQSSTGLLSSVNTSLSPNSGTGGTVNFLPSSNSASAQPITAPSSGLLAQPAATPTPVANSGDANNQPANPVLNPATTGNATATSLLPTNYGPTAFGPQQPTTPPPASSYSASYMAQAKGPTNWNVTPNQTVSGQYQNLMAAGNPAIEAAKAATLRGYAAAGGGNDLMAQNAANLAGSQVALSMAAADAQTYAAAGQYNATAANNFNQTINQVIANSTLSQQNFEQGMSMLAGQTNQQLNLMAAQVNASAATAAINLNSFAAQTQISQQATLQQMKAQYGYNLGEMSAQAGINSQAALQQFGFSMQLNYLGQIANLQANLTNELGQIQSNPNITQTQANGAVADSINQFNTFLTQLNAYYGAMMPGAKPASSTSTSSTTAAVQSTIPGGAITAPASTYNTPAFNYTYIDPTSWPAPSTKSGSSLTSNSGVSSRTLL